MGARTSLLSAAIAGCLIASSGCWYDSSWGQAKAAQRRIAQKTAPSSIRVEATEGDDAGPRSTTSRTYRVRLRPNEHYLAQTVDARRQLAELVEDANAMLVAAAGLRLDVEATTSWSFDADEDLPGALDALRSDDPAQDVDLVIGLVGALPRQTDSLHEGGIAEVLGKHLVLRAASRIYEHAEVDRAFSELTADEREHMIQVRKRHRALAVLLHEIGHVLGALHESSRTSLMHAVYDLTMSAFGGGAVALMRIAVGAPDRPSLVQAQLDFLRAAGSEDWSPGERDREIANLEGQGRGVAPQHPPVAGGGGTAGLAPADSAPPELQGADREHYVQAWTMFRAGGVAQSYATAKALFFAYPESQPVQDLRCQLATVRHLERDAMIAECAPYSRLAATRDGGK